MVSKIFVRGGIFVLEIDASGLVMSLNCTSEAGVALQKV
jgi:hypothetical protein